MIKINNKHLQLQNNYLFAEIAKRVKEFQVNHPNQQIIKLGIGDVTEPIIPAVIAAMHKAVDEMAVKETFKGYPDTEGYAFLREAIAKNDYQDHGMDITAKDIFISDGAKSDCANIQELFSADAKIAVTDPVYPVYVDSNIMAGRGGEFSNEA
jgi:LL-diaminopimelate aminotransferase